VATVIAFRRPSRKEAAQGPEANQRSVEQFWRKSMVSASIVMGVIVVVAVGALVYAVKHGLMTQPWATWVLVGALVSIIGLSKVIVANMFFYIMLQDEARMNEQAPAPPDSSRKTVPLRRIARAIPTRRRPRRVRGTKRAAVLRFD
jgi:uncharacterized membrane protein